MDLTARFEARKWGSPGAPLLPESLRATWNGEKMPGWLVEEIGLPAGTSLDQLDANAWNLGLKNTRRFEHYLVSLIAARRAEIKHLPVLRRPWPPGLVPEDIPWGTRVRNALGRARLLVPTKLAALTFGDVFELPAVGAKSVLEFATTLDASVESLSDASILAETFDPEMLDESWIDMVSSEDPRFVHVLPAGRGTVGQRLEAAAFSDEGIRGGHGVALLVRALPKVVERVEQIAAQSLDVALKQFVCEESGLDGNRLRALLARLGLDGQPKRTLDEAGQMISVSRERMRQIETKFKKRLPSHPVFMPALDDAMDLIAAAAPLDAEEAAELLRNRGLSSIPFHPRSLLAAAAICGRPETFHIERLPKGERVVTTSTMAHARQVISVASRQADSIGVSNVAEVVAALQTDGLDVAEEEVRDILEQHSDAEFLGDQWFWMPRRSPDRNRLRNVTRAMLSVVSPLPISSIREGIRRRYRWRGVSIVPPRGILTDFYRAHPEFTLEGEDRVGSVTPLDYRLELGSTEQSFIEVLRSAPAGVLDRASFEAGSLERGVNTNTFSVYTTYSPIIEHLGTDIWALRGVQVDPAAIEALRRANAQRPRDRRVQDYGWTPDGRLWLAVRVGRTPSLVIGIPAAISNYVVDRRFPATATGGSHVGEVAIGENGSSWGYGPFLSRMGADEGDVLRIEFDLVAETAFLKLGGDDLIEENS